MRTITHKFVDYIPEDLESGILYISLKYKTAVHNCVCGCGNRVVTPVSPTDWKVTYDGQSVSLYPSIGNWSFDCKSHYWIKSNKIRYASQWDDTEIELGRKQDKRSKKKYFRKKNFFKLFQLMSNFLSGSI